MDCEVRAVKKKMVSLADVARPNRRRDRSRAGCEAVLLGESRMPAGLSSIEPAERRAEIEMIIA